MVVGEDGTREWVSVMENRSRQRKAFSVSHTHALFFSLPLFPFFQPRAPSLSPPLPPPSCFSRCPRILEGPLTIFRGVEAECGIDGSRRNVMLTALAKLLFYSLPATVNIRILNKKKSENEKVRMVRSGSTRHYSRLGPRAREKQSY